MLDLRSNSIQFLGIHGMGGIGKTTLANVIFNRLSCHFKDRHFLPNVRELSQHHGLLYLQKQLLSKFLGSSSYLDNIYDTYDGIRMIKRVLGNRKVLIVLDDVDEKEQLRSLAEEGDWFGPGSRIIITSRDQRVLKIVREAKGEGHVEKSTKVSAYELRELEFEDALELFSKHAFRKDSPPNHYGPLSNEIVSTLGMLPLALEVIGSSLNNESTEFWQATLRKLKDAPPKEVQSKLMISYDKLDDEQKEVFLDIACFFVNKDKTYPFYMWDAYGYHPHVAIKDLFLMSLIKIKDDNTFWMHDQVRDLGRDIVRRENRKDPCKRSRAWNPEDVMSILMQKEGSEKIEALSFRHPGSDILEADQFVDLRNLRFFRGEGVTIGGDFDNLLSGLRWLSCHNCPVSFLTRNFRPTNLVVLDLSRSIMLESTISWIKDATKLKVLDLDHCSNLRRTPDISTLVSLEILRLSNCQYLESIHWIKAARKLKVLDLSGCYNLSTTLDLSMSVSLEILRLRDCKKIKKLPDSIGKLQSLIELDLIGINHLPDSFGSLEQLTTLRMMDIEGGLTKLPSAIWLVQLVASPYLRPGHLSCLKMSDMSWTQISELPTVVSLVSNIHKLEIAAADGRWFRETVLRELENVIALPNGSCVTQSQLKEQIFASPKMPDLSWTQISELPTVRSLSDLRKHESAVADGRWFRETVLRELENVIVLPSRSCVTQSEQEEQILASPKMRFLLQLPSSLRESVFRELATSNWEDRYTSIYTPWWMPIFVGICDSELEKRHLQDCTLTRRLELFEWNMREKMKEMEDRGCSS